MPRLAILAATIGALSWSGEALVSTMPNSDTGPAIVLAVSPNLPRYHSHTCCECHSSTTNSGPKRRGRPQSVSSPFSSSTLHSASSHRRFSSSSSSSSSLKAALLNDSSSSGRGKHGDSSRGQKRDGTGKKSPGWHRRILGKIPWRRQAQGLVGGGGPTYTASSSSLPSASVSVEHEEPDVRIDSFAVYRDDFVVQNFEALKPESVLPIVRVDQKQKQKQKRKSATARSRSRSLSSSKLEAGTKTERSSRKLPAMLDSEYLDVSIMPASSNGIGKTTNFDDSRSIAEHTQNSNSNNSNPNSNNSNNSRKGMVGRVLENILTERIGQRWTTESPEDLKVDVRTSPDKYNNIARLLFKGLYRADATLSSGRIVFPNIRFSSVRLQMEQVTLNLMGFFSSNDKHEKNKNTNRNENKGNPNQHQHNGRTEPKKRKGKKQRQLQKQKQNTEQSQHQATGTVRYPNQFDIHIEDLTMSRHDLLFSSCIKNGLRGLLIRALKDRGVRSNSIRITSIDILPNGKISCIGEAKTHFVSAPPVHFEVRSGISYSNRGHVLTFPGLEVSLNRDIGLFVPVHPTLDLDVGHNTKFRSIVIDGRKKRLKIAASVTITPDRTRLLTQDYVQTSDAFSAIFFYDIGQWLTRLGRFSK